ncbi:hypothetical protein EG835_11670 [bacterium]|nr:hypothetical protein [bacterium]
MARFPRNPEEESMTEADQVEEMLGQVLVVFGQGTGVIRIPRKTVAAIRSRYVAMKDRALPVWDTQAAEALDRVRIVGRLAAQNAVARGANEVSAEDFAVAADIVEPRSGTLICNQGP